MKNLGEVAKDLEFDVFEEPEEQKKDASKEASNAEESMEGVEEQPTDTKKTLPPKEDEYLWVWKVCLVLFSLFILEVSSNLNVAGARDYQAYFLFVVLLVYFSRSSVGKACSLFHYLCISG